MNKKGFTLIELLAVIVILAIIALIATPIVLNIISDSKESSELRSADFYLDALELSIAQSTLDGKAIDDNTYNIMPNGNICLEEFQENNNQVVCNDKDGISNNNELEVEVKGETPKEGTIEILNGQIANISITLDNKEIIKNFKGELIYNLKLEEMCELEEGPSKTVGAKYSCDFGAGKRNFYILELGSNKVEGSSLKDDEVALILEGNYDETTQKWCATGKNNSCNADGLIPKLDEIACAWTQLGRSQVVLPSVEQVATVAGVNYLSHPTISSSIDWLYNWEGNDIYGGSVVSGYWTSSPNIDNPSTVWFVNYLGNVYDLSVESINIFGVRPVIILKIK